MMISILKNKKQVLGILGALLWTATIFLRDMDVSTNATYQFIRGVMPNFASVMVLVGICYSSIPMYKKNLDDEKKLIGLSVLILIAVTGSEIAHVIFTSAGFDVYDIIASCLALLIVNLTTSKKSLS